jgi:hypothetical protein
MGVSESQTARIMSKINFDFDILAINHHGHWKWREHGAHDTKFNAINSNMGFPIHRNFLLYSAFVSPNFGLNRHATLMFQLHTPFDKKYVEFRQPKLGALWNRAPFSTLVNDNQSLISFRRIDKSFAPLPQHGRNFVGCQTAFCNESFSPYIHTHILVCAH